MIGSLEFSRRDALVALAGAVAALRSGIARAAEPRLGAPATFSWDRLVADAQKLSRRPFAPPAASGDPASDFDTAVKRAYGAADTLAGLVRLLPVTRLAPTPVRIHIVEDGRARDLLSTRGLFAEGAGDAAGFRVLNSTGKSDWLAFQGASYFRAAGSQDQYGLSARGIAVDTGLPRPEEFPAFTDFWIEAVDAQRVRVYAMLDGPSLSGAYAFDSSLGAQGVEQKVRAALFPRRAIEQLGIAPATSMFWYGENRRGRETDWRPEVHDSDGLAVWAGNGERIWRPLVNPESARLTSFRADGVKGFGLLQRDRNFANYQDDGAFYDRRPNLWVVPDGDWGRGAVQLYEMPTDGETLDNIVAFWRGDRAVKAGQRRDISYTLHWTSDDPSADGAARVVDIWTGSGGIPGAPPAQGVRKIVIDFEGQGLVGLGRSDIEAEVNLTAPALKAKSCYPVVGAAGRWRVMLDFRRDEAKEQELRLFLRRGNAALSETLIEPLSP